MLPILDFFYGIIPSYGLAIVLLTLVVRFALYPLSAGSIRSMRRMKVAQPIMQKRVKEIQERYKDNPAKQQEEMSQVYKEFGNPLSGCLPLLVQMPVLFALFATLRGSPFSDVNYNINLNILPTEKMEQVQVVPFSTAAQNIYFTDNTHGKIIALLPSGNNLGIGETTKIEFQTPEGKPLNTLVDPEHPLTPKWKITNGEERVKIDSQGNITAIADGEVTIQATIPGLASDKGFLFIDALGRVGAVDSDGTLHFDIIGMVVFFGLSLYINQMLSGQDATNNTSNPQQQTINKITPIIFSGMFLFFPLPAGVLMYMVIANIFQTIQTFILIKEPLPENLQKIVEQQEKQEKGRQPLPFEPNRSKKKASN